MKRRYFSLPGAFVGFAALLCGPSAALAQIAPPLGVLQQFSVMANSAVTGSAGAGTLVAGDVGSFPTNTITNFPPSSVTAGFFVRRIAFGDGPLLLQARTDSIAAFAFLGSPPQGAPTLLAAQLDGVTLVSGVFNFAAAADIAALGTLTLNGPGVFVFQVPTALTANVGSNIVGTANPCNVFWQIGTSATLNGVTFRGNVFADASITVGAGNVQGRTIAGTGATGAVTMTVGGNTIGGCATAGAPPSLPVPALPDVAAWGLLAILLAGGAFALGRR